MADPAPPSSRRTVASPPGEPRPVTATAPRSRWDEQPSGSIFAGRYRVERLLARGGMSGVYLAWQLPLNRPVALKILVPLMEDADGEASFQERFRLEARTLAALNHPNIVVVHDYGETDDGQFFLAMEYVDGPRLSDLLKETGRLPVQRALHLVLQTCQALRYAHVRGVIHRDIKLSNIMVWSDGERDDQVKVVDFGLVKLTEGDQRLTSAGMVLGSPHFMSPEQARGQHVDHRADIYAVGIMLYCMLAGQPPYTGTSATSTILAHLTQPVPSVAAAAPDAGIPDALDVVLQRCMAKKAEDRYPDMETLIHDLTALLEGRAPVTQRSDGPSGATLVTYTTVETPAVPATENRTMMWGAIAGTVVLLIVISGLALTVAGLMGGLGSSTPPPQQTAVPVVAPPPTNVSGPTLAQPVLPPLQPPPSATDASSTAPVSSPTQGPRAPRTGPANTVEAPQPESEPPPAGEQPSAAPESAPVKAAPTGAQPAGEDWQKSDLKDPWSNN